MDQPWRQGLPGEFGAPEIACDPLVFPLAVKRLTQRLSNDLAGVLALTGVNLGYYGLVKQINQKFPIKHTHQQSLTSLVKRGACRFLKILTIIPQMKILTTPTGLLPPPAKSKINIRRSSFVIRHSLFHPKFKIHHPKFSPLSL